MVLMFLFAVQKWRNIYSEQAYGHAGRRKERMRCIVTVVCTLTFPYVK